MDFLVKHSPAGLIVDPFCGSGTTGIAAVKAGREFLGVEMSEDWAAFARTRIAGETQKSDLFGEAA